MTKVKTILAEFCSPKDILAINRLGLLKKEERESQPVPWRHRLSNAERRELVKSEMRMSIRPSRSRVSAIDKAKAFQSAANPVQSRMGECLYSIHLREDPLLGSSLVGLKREQSRLEASQKYSRQEFVSRSYSFNHEPLLLVEREPSQTVKTRAMLMSQHGIDPQTLLKPSYMRPLEYQAAPPSTIPTIDAFVAESRKKQNVWEQVLDEAEPTKFRSTARPYTRLSESEMQQLRLGHAFHKPRPPPANRPAPSRSESQHSKQSRRHAGEGTASGDAQDSVFITQQRFTTRDSAGASKQQARDVRHSGDTPQRARTRDQDLGLESGVQEDAGMEKKSSVMAKSKVTGGGGGSASKTVTFAGVTAVSPDSPTKSITKKHPRPVTVASEMGKAYTVRNPGRVRPKSENTKSKNENHSDFSAPSTKPSSKPSSETQRHRKSGVAQSEKGRNPNMSFLNTLLEVPQCF